ncbi:MdtA/MuxA family multidrug efflux RND transporter periplasmic adaptor subunit [Candidatus Thiodictyon syntrophicum]|jgi:multidrug efflux system membrane fusion protein|uniref:Multidrug transporter subunit MdtA n=1 Tax=Candidatus Thiodictyon syntrophicum TaxID=1166950 RepID=A0A2K8UCG0_9GAMM|nr:MdtA/MuxA family multidrug efflux RND transporter periplasmic adaptor subunit [Candidatus Thiodictyon syntrophicum]AUB82741.1 multidrug transporter subunit MdtA [Candidatus Thiodictyon syntrophicum]
MTSEETGAKRRRYLPLLGLVLAGLAAAFAYWHWFGGGPAGQGSAEGGNPGRGAGNPGGRGGAQTRPVPVVAAAARTGAIKVYLRGLGTVTARNTVTVRTQVDGQLMRLAFTEGQTVKAGDLLAEIDPRPFQVLLLQAQGALARDQALLDNARVDLERYRTLYQQDSGSKQQWDTQKALAAQYEGAIKTDLAQIESAKLQLTYARIKAPIGGRVGLRLVDAGNIVRAADATGLAVITEVEPILVIFTLPEDDLQTVLKQVRAGTRLTVDAYDKAQKTKLASGVLLTMDNQIDPTTGTIRLKAEFPNEDGRLFPNQFVNAHLLVDTLHDATLIPTAAVQRGVQGTYVYVVGPQQSVSVRPVTLGAAEGDEVAVSEGLAPGELVVVDGTDKLREGAKVAVEERDAAKPAGQGTPMGAAPEPAPAEGRRRRPGVP